MAAVTLLSTRCLDRAFGGVHAVRHVDFELKQGDIHALIGPNGAGKTTFVDLVSGRTRAGSGSVHYRGQDITDLPAYKRVRLGIAYTFQITSIYPNLPVYENVAIAAQSSGGLHRHGLSDRVTSALGKVGINQRERDTAGEMAYGHQRLLEVAMGLVLEPSLLILDEPTQGLSDGEIEGFCSVLRDIRKSATILLIEHNMSVVMALADRITVFNRGEVLAEGNPGQIQDNAEVQAAYLGS